MENIETTSLQEEPNEMAYPSIAQGWGIFGMFLLLTLAIGVPIGIIKLGLGDFASGPMLLLTYSLPLIILIYIAKLKREKNPLNEKKLHFRFFPMAILPVAILVTYAILVINIEVTSWIPVPEWVMELFREFARDDIWGFLTIAVAAPLLEEALMRGIVLDGMLKNYNPWKAIIWSAILFGVLHLNPWQFISAFLMGVVMGYLYWKTKSLWLCIFIHALNNGTAFFLMQWYPEASGAAEMFGFGAMQRAGIFILAVLIVLVSYNYLEKYFQNLNVHANE